MGVRLDKIKQFFSKLFRGEEEKKLLMEGSKPNMKREDFISGIRVDAEDPLNPEIYNGDRLLSNILMHVGLRKELAENPAVINEMSRYLGRNYARSKEGI